MEAVELLQARQGADEDRPRLIGSSSNPSGVRSLAAGAHPLGRPVCTEIDAFAIGLGPVLDLAEGWDCVNGADCENRAYAGELYPTETEARRGVRAYMLDRCRKLFPGWSAARAYWELDQRDGLEQVFIVKVSGEVDACFDYREVGCQMDGAFDQLRLGEGRGAAWSLVRRHRDRYGAHAVRLPGPTHEGHLFAFVGACRNLRMRAVAKISPPAP
jgi:hypothetical protein